MSNKRKAGAGSEAASGYPFRVEKRKDQYSRAAIYAVHGFWSGDYVRVSQSRDCRDGKWEAPQIIWSCGGRDHKQESDDIVAVGCFAKAMTAAVRVARKWQKDNDLSYEILTNPSSNSKAVRSQAKGVQVRPENVGRLVEGLRTIQTR